MAGTTSLKALRLDVGVGLGIVWNALCGWGIYLNGGMGRIHDPEALAVVVAACGLVSVFFGAAILSSRFRTAVTAQSRRHHYSARSWGIIAAVTGLLCLAGVATLVGWLPLPDVRS